MKDIELKGNWSALIKRPASLNIPERVVKCLDHILENHDRSFDDVPFVGVTLGEDPPHFTHCRLDWTEVLPYSIYGTVIARNITGSHKGEEIQLAQRRLLLSHFNNLDGLVHAPCSPWNHRYPLCLWEQARTLYALIYWFQDSQEENLFPYMDGIVDGLFALSHQEGVQRVFPDELLYQSGMRHYGVTALIDPLLKYHELSGNARACQLAMGITHFIFNSWETYFSEAEGANAFINSFRPLAAAVNNISKAASVAGDDKLLHKAKDLHDRAISYCTAYGSTPCLEPACSDMELNMSALSLIQAGYDDYWDQIDRFVRNQTAEAQFLDAGEWVQAKASKKRITDKEFQWIMDYWSNDLPVLPYDDYRDVLQRSLGGFTYSSPQEHLFIPAALMLCCSAHALCSFDLVWQRALTERHNQVYLNLHYSLENAIGEVISYEPFTGKTSVILKKDADLNVRIPEHARVSEVKGTCDGEQAPITINGRYTCFKHAQKGKEYSLEYSLSQRATEESQFRWKTGTAPFHVSYQVRWRGNTVIAVLPESKEEKRLYKRQHLDTDEIPYKEIKYFISSKETGWW